MDALVAVRFRRERVDTVSGPLFFHFPSVTSLLEPASLVDRSSL